jgi:hypothetical protein
VKSDGRFRWLTHEIDQLTWSIERLVRHGGEGSREALMAIVEARGTLRALLVGKERTMNERRTIRRQKKLARLRAVRSAGA